MVLPGLKDYKESKGTQVIPDLSAHKDHKASLEKKEILDRKGFPDLKAILDLPD